MTTKEKVICESIMRVQKRIKEIDDILNATPLQEIIKIRKEFQELIKSKLPLQEEIKMIEKFQKEEEKQLKIFEKQQNTLKLIDEKVKLAMELSDLKGELYWIKRH